MPQILAILLRNNTVIKISFKFTQIKNPKLTKIKKRSIDSLSLTIFFVDLAEIPSLDSRKIKKPPPHHAASPGALARCDADLEKQDLPTYSYLTEEKR